LFLCKSMIPRELLGSAEVPIQSRSTSQPPAFFVQVFIPMGLGLTICGSYASRGFVAVFVGEEKTSGGRSGTGGAVSSKAGDKKSGREAEVWPRANMCDCNK